MVLCPAGEVLLELSGRPTRLAVTSPRLEHGERRGGERVETLTVEGLNINIHIYNIWKMESAFYFYFRKHQSSPKDKRPLTLSKFQSSQQ